MLVHPALYTPLLLLPARPIVQPSVVMGWADPGWNWGSAMGTAHDAAMEIRSRLRSEEARKDFLSSIFSGVADPEDAKLALVRGVSTA